MENIGLSPSKAPVAGKRENAEVENDSGKGDWNKCRCAQYTGVGRLGLVLAVGLPGVPIARNPKSPHAAYPLWQALQ
jgi:hypothetical protein